MTGSGRSGHVLGSDPQDPAVEQGDHGNAIRAYGTASAARL